MGCVCVEGFGCVKSWERKNPFPIFSGIFYLDVLRFLKFYLDVSRLNKTDFILDFPNTCDIIEEKGVFKMKKRIYKFFRRIRRNIARFIVGYDRCPADCRKNYKEIAATTAEAILIVAVIVGFFLVIALLFN